MNAKHIFTGTINTDADLQRINSERGDYLHALNTRNGHNSTRGSMSPVRGFEEIENPYLPDGTNLCIGAVEDKYNTTQIFFVWNSNNDHCIFRFYPLKKNSAYPKGIIEPLIISSELNFTQNNLIHGVVIDDFLIWTDAYGDNDSQNGNEVKKLNLDRARWMDKKLCYSFTYGLPNPYNVNFGIFKGTWSFVVRAPFDSATVFQTQVTYSGADNIEDFIDWLKGRNSIFNNFEVKDCGDHLEMCYNLPGYTITASKQQNSASINWFPVNYLPDGLKAEQLNLIKRPMNFPLAYTWETCEESEDQETKPYQFIGRYIHRDNEKTAWSEPSMIILKTSENPAKILIEFMQAELLFDESWLAFIKGFEIAYRESNTGLYRSHRILSPSEFGVEGLDKFIDFEKDGHRNVIESDDSIPAGEGQFLKLFDWVPRGANTVESISDENGNANLILGGLKENYDLDICPDVTHELIIRTKQPAFSQPEAFVVNASRFDTRNHLTHKIRGRYGWGIEYKDEFGRRSTVEKIGIVDFPEPDKIKEDAALIPDVYVLNDFLQLRFTINHEPPSWAKYYSIVRTRNMVQASYTQLFVGDIEFKKLDGEDSTFDDSWPFLDEFNSDYIQLTIPPVVNVEEENDREVKSFVDSVRVPFDIEAGDFVRIIGKTTVNRPGVAFVYPTMTPKDFEIEACRTDENGNLILLIRKDQDDTYFYSEVDLFFVEVFKPSNEDGEIYYTTGNTYRIENGFHTKFNTPSSNIFYPTDQDQTASQPAIITIFGGDTYIRANDYELSTDETVNRANNIATFERQTFSDYIQTTDEGIGTANIYDPDFGEQYNKNFYRTSDIFVPNSKINGLSSFRSLDYGKINISFGAIKRLVVTHNVALAVCMFKTQPLYIAKDRLMDLSQNSLVGRTDQLVNIAAELKTDFGTHHAESICEEDGFVYGWDVYRGVLWRYSSNGQFPISNYGKTNYFNWFGKNRICLSPYTNKCVSVFHRDFNNVYFSFYEEEPDYTASLEITIDQLYTHNAEAGQYLIVINNGLRYLYQYTGVLTVAVSMNVGEVVKFGDKYYEWETSLILQEVETNNDILVRPYYEGITWAFEEGNQDRLGFPCEMSFVPEMYSRVGLFLFSFQEGKMYLHESTNVPPCFFYGQQESSSVTLVENVQGGIKLYDRNIRIDSDRKLYASKVLIPANHVYADGMESQIPANRFENYEGHWAADFLRDMNDTSAEFLSLSGNERTVRALLRGRYLRGEVLIVTLEPEDPEKDYLLREVDIEFNLSKSTK